MGRSPRVLFLVTSLAVGGIERYVLRVVRHFAPMGWKIDVLCRNGQLGTLAEEVRQAGAAVTPMKISYFSPVSWRRLRGMMCQARYDAVCDFTGDFSGVPLRLARQAGIPKRVAFYRGSTHHFATDPLRMLYWRWVHGLTRRNATSLLSNSAAALDFFHPGWASSGDPRFEVVHNGIPTAEFDGPVNKDALRRELGIPQDAKVIGHVGRYNEAKNHKAMIALAERMCPKRPELVFLLCGRGVPEGLGAEVRQRGLEARVLMPGSRSDIPQLLRLLDAFYFPSYHEGQPNALLEAMVAGVPFVASNIPSNVESVPEQFHHWLVDPNDIVAAETRLSEILDAKGALVEPMAELAAWARRKYDAECCFTRLAGHLKPV